MPITSIDVALDYHSDRRPDNMINEDGLASNTDGNEPSNVNGGGDDCKSRGLYRRLRKEKVAGHNIAAK